MFLGGCPGKFSKLHKGQPFLFNPLQIQKMREFLTEAQSPVFKNPRNKKSGFPVEYIIHQKNRFSFQLIQENILTAGINLPFCFNA